MKKHSVLCSTGALIGRANGRDYRLLEQFAPQLNCDGFEFMMYRSWYEKVKELIRDMRSFALPIPVMHCEKAIGEAVSLGGAENQHQACEQFRVNCEVANELGAEMLVMHLWSGIPSDQHFENNLRFYPSLARIAEECGLQLLIENVVCNHKNPMLHLCELAKEYKDVRFTFDTKMAAFHSELELLYEDEYQWLFRDGFIRHLHINDYTGGYMNWSTMDALPIGEGSIDFDRFFAYLRGTAYDGAYTLEATALKSSGVVDIKMLNDSFEKLSIGLDLKNRK